MNKALVAFAMVLALCETGAANGRHVRTDTRSAMQRPGCQMLAEQLRRSFASYRAQRGSSAGGGAGRRVTTQLRVGITIAPTSGSVRRAARPSGFSEFRQRQLQAHRAMVKAGCFA